MSLVAHASISVGLFKNLQLIQRVSSCALPCITFVPLVEATEIKFVIRDRIGEWMPQGIFTRKGVNELRVGIHFGVNLCLRERLEVQSVKWPDSLVTTHSILYVITQRQLVRYSFK